MNINPGLTVAVTVGAVAVDQLKVEGIDTRLSSNRKNLRPDHTTGVIVHPSSFPTGRNEYLNGIRDRIKLALYGGEVESEGDH
jgi:hypothetical protein